MLALCEVKDGMAQKIEQQRKQYYKIFDEIDTNPMLVPHRALLCSLAFGYLTLESSTWLKYSPADGAAAEFEGVSFSDVCSSVRSMTDFSGWVIVPKSRPVPKRSVLLVFFSLVGVSLHLHQHQVGSQGSFISDFHEELLTLITTMEWEDWGIDLSDVE